MKISFTTFERMAYYSRYATRKKGVVLGVLLLQQVRFWPYVYCSLRLDEHEHFLVCLTTLIDFPK
jgi:hypothetical protein